MVSRSTKFSVRWRRSSLWARLAVLVTFLALFGALLSLQRPIGEEAYFSGNLAVFAVVNLNILILCVLVFLVGRNLVKLIFDRRRGILGSKLRMRLVSAFVSLTLVPSVVLVVVASGLINRAIDGWFSSPAESSVHGSLQVAQIHFDSLEERTLRVANEIALEIQSRQLEFEVDQALREFLEKRRSEKRLFGIELVTVEAKAYLTAFNAAAQIEHFSAPAASKDAVRRALQGTAHVISEDTESSQFVRAYVPLAFKEQSLVLLASHRVRPELSAAMGLVTDSFNEYKQLKSFKDPLRSTYILLLYMLAGLILFAAIWFGFYMARELTGPIQRLAEGTREVARGNYDFRIRQIGDDEIGYLIRSFNTMTSDLKGSREQAERRRIYIETILSTLAVGVIALDRNRYVTSTNAAVRELLGLKDESEILGKPFSQVLPRTLFDEIEPMFLALEQEGVGAASDTAIAHEKEIATVLAGKERRLLCTVGALRELSDSNHRSLGTIWLFDDITTLSHAQRMAAWREAARRIAHEIKNPLTPIRLAAQRLEKFGNQHIAPEEKEFSALMSESTSTIVEHVDSINRLADEFSRFARMPDAEFALTDLNVLLSDTVAPFAETYPDIVFQFVADGKLPDVMMDREQVRRVFLNLIDNATTVLQEKEISAGRILVKTRYDRKQKSAIVEVADNGPGIDDDDKIRVFQPYFTRKANGTGLGLAIVSSIVSDHQGEVRVYDNQPCGTKFIVTLPLAQKQATQRRLAAG